MHVKMDVREHIKRENLERRSSNRVGVTDIEDNIRELVTLVWAYLRHNLEGGLVRLVEGWELWILEILKKMREAEDDLDRGCRNDMK